MGRKSLGLTEEEAYAKKLASNRQAYKRKIENLPKEELDAYREKQREYYTRWSTGLSGEKSLVRHERNLRLDREKDQREKLTDKPE
jgi:hypothetical protein